MTGKVVIDEDSWPLVVFEMHGTIPEEEWLRLFDSYDRFYALRQRFAIVNDTSGLDTVPSAKARKMISDNAKRHEPMSERWVVCSCVVITNALMRGALKAITWLNEPAYPLHHTANRLDAVQLAVEALGAEGLVVDPKAIAGASSLR